MDTNSTYEKIEKVLSHIQNVQRNCYKLGMKLIMMNELELGRNLIAHGQIHDNSKLSGIEFEHLFAGDAILGDVIKHHAQINPHHPEHWGSIQKMPEVYVAEMVCDCIARSSEFGTDVRVWFRERATTKYGFSMDDAVGTMITKYIDLVLEKPFT